VKNAAPSMVEATRHNEGARFGSKSVAAPDRMRHVSAQAGDEAVTAVPWWRRLLGLLNPLSWMRTH
jgi:hypothetical protein